MGLSRYEPLNGDVAKPVEAVYTAVVSDDGLCGYEDTEMLDSALPDNSTPSRLIRYMTADWVVDDYLAEMPYVRKVVYEG